MPIRWRCRNCRRDHDRKLHENDWAFIQETINGVFHRESLHTQSPKEAQRRYREKLKEYQAAVPDPSKGARKLKKLTIAEAIELYIEDRKADVSKGQVKAWQVNARALSGYFKNLRLEQINNAHGVGIEDALLRLLPQGDLGFEMRAPGQHCRLNVMFLDELGEYLRLTETVGDDHAQARLHLPQPLPYVFERQPGGHPAVAAAEEHGAFRRSGWHYVWPPSAAGATGSAGSACACSPSSGAGERSMNFSPRTKMSPRRATIPRVWSVSAGMMRNPPRAPQMPAISPG